MLKYWFEQNYQLAKAYVDWARGAPKLHRRFFRNHGYQLNLENPQTFSEKIQWRKLRDNNPIFLTLSNKYLARGYITDKLGQERAENLMVPLLQYEKDPANVDFSVLPAQFVLKATHGSGMNLIVEDASKLDELATRKLMRKWLMTHYAIRDHEWNYTKTPKGILVEALISNPSQLVDVKLFFFSGKVRIILMIERKAGREFSTFFDALKKPLDVEKIDTPKNPEAALPAELDEMIECGEVLSQDMDFVRVDFLSTPNRFFIGELTQHPNSGMLPFDPLSADRVFGSHWRLPMEKSVNTRF